MYITDTETGETRLYGTNCHDSLVKSDDGRCLYYENLQCGEGSKFGAFLFTDEQGRPPKDNDVLIRHGAEDYFNIGGFGEIHMSQIKEIKAEIEEKAKYGESIKEPSMGAGLYLALDIINKHIGKEQE